jgi:hypothetical protein
VTLFSLFILTGKTVLVAQRCKVPTHPFPGMVIPVCRITNGCGRKTLSLLPVRHGRSCTVVNTAEK